MTVFERILANRGLGSSLSEVFLYPKYENIHDAFLLPDIKKAIVRLKEAYKNKEKITVYGDYDIDGITATVLMVDALKMFGFHDVAYFVPNRFEDGFGLNEKSIEKIANDGTRLILTVDCGSVSQKEIEKANELNLDIIVTDHHNVLEKQPPAVAIINPKIKDSKYPFKDLAGVGVAFKLVQAMQTEFDGIDYGQEKWLLDLVALGTVCDIVSLTDENRILVYYGLKVLQKSRRQGILSLMEVSGVDKVQLDSYHLGFVLGPRMNAAGRLETAKYAIEMLLDNDKKNAHKNAIQLEKLNQIRRSDQLKILNEAIYKIENMPNQSVIVVSDQNWNHGIVGIVASKLLEKYHKPAIVIQEIDELSKGSARSFGDFNIADAINFSKDFIVKGGGHSLAAGITLRTEQIDNFRQKINEYYEAQSIDDQSKYWLPKADTEAKLSEINEDLVNKISLLEPFGNGNPKPIIKSNKLIVNHIKYMGDSNQHIKLSVLQDGIEMTLVGFNIADKFSLNLNDQIDIWYEPTLNAWNGRKSVEGRIIHIEQL